MAWNVGMVEPRPTLNGTVIQTEETDLGSGGASSEKSERNGGGGILT